MVKKLLTFILGLGLAAGASATINFPASDIQFWVGTGSNSAVVVVAWDDASTPTALAWGVRWNGTVSALDLIDSIQTHDSRFSNGSSATAASITYSDGTVTLTSPTNYWCYTVNGQWATVGYTGYYMSDGDIMELSGTCMFSMTSAVAATDPNPAPAAPALCDSVHALPYAQAFSDCPANQSPAKADAPIPDCWTLFSNGRYTRDTTPGAYIYYGGMATAYSTNNYGCVTANDPFFCLIACQIYTGTNAAPLNDMLDFGTCKYAVLPPFDQPLSQTRLAFDYRTSNTSALLLLGYVINDTSDFVVLDSFVADYRVLHQMNLRLDSLDAAIPDDARLAFCWKSTSTTTSYPSNIYVGIDNLTVSLVSSDPDPDPDPDPVDATIAFSDILYWVGSGSDSAALIVSYAQPDTAFAWGVLFTSPVSATDLLDSVQAADPRFSYVGNPSNGGDIRFVMDNGDTIGLSPDLPTDTYGNYFWTNLNGVSTWGENVQNGDVLKYGDAHSGIGYDMQYGYYMQYAWTTVPTPVSVPDTTSTPDPVDPIDPQPTIPDATVDFADITCWAGSGSDSTALIVSFANPDTAFAWGVLINGTTTSANMLNAVMAVDTNLSITGHPDWGDGQIRYRLANGTVISRTATQWLFNINGVDAWGDGVVSAGDVFKFGDQASGIQMSTFQYVWTAEPTIVNFCDSTSVIDTTASMPVDVSIAAAHIRYWVGEGSNRVVMAVNWADTALAWGYRFDTEQTTATLMMEAIAAADPRFDYVMGLWGVGDIRYIDIAAGMTDTLGITPGNYWWSLLNGEGALGMGTPLRDGDFFKWGDLSVATVTDSVMGDWGMEYTYVWTRAITPVSVPDTTSPIDPQPGHGPFCGAVGTEDCDAIPANSDAIVAWATACTLELGPENISVAGSPAVSYGSANDAVGPCSMTDNLSVVSLGDGGSATLTFAKPIRNGEGPDFAVFENSFNDTFLELAFVEVSSDGERFVRFPATSLTQTETQATGIDPTYINNLAGKFRMGYGTPFDLEELRDSTGINLDSIVYVRVVDVVGSIDPQYATYDAFGHIVNDPWPTNSYSSGFDLDGVAVIHQAEVQGIDGVEVVVSGLWPNPTVGELYVSANRPAGAVLYDFAGRQVAAYNLVAGTNVLDFNALPAGIYMLHTEGSVCKIVKQ